MQWACNINCQIYINSFFPEIKAKQKSVYQHQSLSLSMHEYWLGSFYRWIRLFNHHLVIYIMNVIIQRIPIYFKNLKVCYPSLLALILWLTWTRESYCQIGIHQTWVMNYFYKYSNCPNPRYVPIGPASTVLIQSMFLGPAQQWQLCNFKWKKKSIGWQKVPKNWKCSSLVYTNIHIMHLVCTNNSCYIWRG